MRAPTPDRTGGRMNWGRAFRRTALIGAATHSAFRRSAVVSGLATMLLAASASANCQLAAHGDSQYWICHLGLPAPDAAQACAAMGLSLVPLGSAVDIPWLLTAIPAPWGDMWWVGSHSGEELWCEGQQGGGGCALWDNGCVRSAPCLEAHPYVCAGICDDGSPCTVDTLDPLTAQCSHQFIATPCSDDNVCTAGEFCAGASASPVAASPSSGPQQCVEGFAPQQCAVQPFVSPNNLASPIGSGAGVPVARDSFAGLAIHHPSNLNDGKYGNGSSWIAVEPNNWIKIDLGQLRIVSSVKLGRDRIAYYGDRPPGRIAIWLAKHDAVYAMAHDGDDEVEYRQVFDSDHTDFLGALAAGETIEFVFAPTEARYVKVTVELAGAAIDEVEIFGAGEVGGCQPAAVLDCDDGNPCTTDMCDPVQGCVYIHLTSACDDGNPCTMADSCHAGECVGTPRICDIGTDCNWRTCGVSGTCEPGELSVVWLDAASPSAWGGGANLGAKHCGPDGWVGDGHITGTGYVEYGVTLPAGGHNIWMRYASELPRPVRVLLDGEVVAGGVLSEGTGSFCGGSALWREVAVVSIAQAGMHTLRIEHDPSLGCCFPHIDEILITNALSFAPPAAPANALYGLADNPVIEGSPCGGQNACIGPGVCEQGRCNGEVVACSDTSDCTFGICDPSAGCVSGAPVATYIDASAPSAAAGGASANHQHCGPQGWTGAGHTIGTGSLEYSFVAAGGAFDVWLRYAAETPRPVDVYIDDILVAPTALNASTGSWCGTAAQWTRVARTAFDTPGAHTLRIQHDAVLSCCFPHIDAVLITNVSAFTPPPSPIGPMYGPADGPSLDGATCSDPNSCTVNGVCASGNCLPNSADPCSDGNSCTIDICNPTLGCIHTPAPDAECAYALHSVLPSASEAPSQREFELVGPGLAATTLIEVPGATVLQWHVKSSTSLIATVALPSSGGEFDIVVTDTLSGLSFTKLGAITALAAAACQGVRCGSCESDVDCVDGDACTTDLCVSGLCFNEPSASCCASGECHACAVAFDFDATGFVNVSDVQCGLLTALWMLAGKGGLPPSCLKVPLAAVDANCDGQVNVSDLLLTIRVALGTGIGEALDTNGDGCVDACSAVPTVQCATSATHFVSQMPGASCETQLIPTATGAQACYPSPLSLEVPGTVAAICTAQSPGGEAVNCIQSLTLIDDAPPTIQCAAPQIVECLGGCATPATAGAVASDTCSPATVLCPGAQGPFCLGLNAVTCTASDLAGNTSSCQSLVNVVDTVAPSPICVPPLSQLAGAGGVGNAPDVFVSASDICVPAAALVVAQTPPPGAPLAPGVHPISITATDTSGNVGQCETFTTVEGLAVPTSLYGDVVVHTPVSAPAGSPAGTQCLAGQAPVPFPGSNANMGIVACYSADYSSLLSVTFHAAPPLDHLGTVNLKGTYDTQLQLLCMEGEVQMPAHQGWPLSASLTARVCLSGATTLNNDLVTLSGTIISPLGSAWATGTLHPTTGRVCLEGALSVQWQGLQAGASAKVCLVFQSTAAVVLESATLRVNASMAPFGTAELEGSFASGDVICLGGALSGDTSAWLPIAEASVLALNAKACVQNQLLTTADLSAVVRVGSGASALTMQASGTYADASSTLALSLGLAPGCPSADCAWSADCDVESTCNVAWRPFADLGGAPMGLRMAAFTQLGGTLTLDSTGVALEVAALLSAGDAGLVVLPGAPGLTLHNATASARAHVKGSDIDAFSVKLGGEAHIPLGFETLILDISGSVSNLALAVVGSVRTLSGETLSLFGGALGQGGLDIGFGGATANLVVTFPTDTLPAKASADISATASLGLLGSSATASVNLIAELEPEAWRLTMVGVLQQLEILLGGESITLGEGGVVVLAASTAPAAGYAVNTGSGEPLVLDLDSGVTLLAKAQLGPLGVVDLKGNFGGQGDSCLTGTLVPGSAPWLPLPDVTLLGMGVRACIKPGGELGPAEVDGAVRFGQGASALTIAVAGSYFPPNVIELSAGLAPGCASADCNWTPLCSGETCSGTWAPFKGLTGAPEGIESLTFTALSGTLRVDSTGPSLNVVATVGGAGNAVQLAPGVALNELSAQASIGADAQGELKFSVGLGGKTSIDLGFDTILLALRGDVTSEGIHFSGSVSSQNHGLKLDPFGGDMFSIALNNAAASLTVDFAKDTVSAGISASAGFGLFGLTVTPAVQVDIRRDEAGWAFTAAALVQSVGITVGEFSLTLGGGSTFAAIIGSNRAMPNYTIDADGDASNGKETAFELKAGITLVAMADLTFLEDYFEDFDGGALRTVVKVEVVSQDQFGISGQVQLSEATAFIRPEDHMPGLHSMWISSFGLSVSVQGESFKIGIDGAVGFRPLDRASLPQAPITANAKFFLDLQKKALGGEVYLDGWWREPFWIPDVAMLNPGLSATLMLKSVKPPVFVPTSLGFNGQAFYRKSGEWPETIVLDAQGSPSNLPAGIASVGATFLYDVTPTKSGICLFGVCAPLPTVIARLDLQNLALSDMVTLADRMREAVVSLATLPELEALGVVVPQSALEPLDISPLDVQLHQALVYFSTHNVKKFGVNFTTGVRLAFDGSVTDLLNVTHSLSLDGFLSPTGLRLSGQVSPIVFIPGLETVGDPYRRYVALNGGHLQVPHHQSLGSPRTIEGWIRTNGPSLLAAKVDGGNGFEVGTGSLAPTDCGDEAGCPKALVARALLRNAGATRWLTSAHGVIQPGALQHLALTLQDDGTPCLYVDGSAVELIDQAPAAQPGMLPDTSPEPLRIGQGALHIDDVRFWTVARSSADIRGEAQVMPFAFRHDTTLLARYEFDLDLELDLEPDASLTAYNSRVGAVAPHGTYVGGASSAVDLNQQDLYFKLVLDTNNLASSGMWFRGGLLLDFDPPIPGAALSYAAEASVGVGKVNGTLFARDLPLFGIPGLGGFKLTGNGPNGVQGDFDDGLYLSGDLLKSPAPTLNASSRLVFVNAAGAATTISAASLLFDCLKPDGCPTVLDYTLRFDGALNWQLPLPGVGAFGLTGNYFFDSDELRFEVDGSLVAFGQTFSASKIHLGPGGAAFSSSVDLSQMGLSFLGATQSAISASITFEPPRLCVSGETTVDVPGLALLTGAANACVGTNPYANFEGTGSVTFGDLVTAQANVWANSESGLYIDEAYVSLPGLFQGTLSGHYVSPSDFSFQGTTSQDLGFGPATTTLAIGPSGATALMQLNPDCTTCIIQATLQGDVATDASGAPSFDLHGAANVTISGRTLANAVAHLSSATGLRFSGILDLGYAQSEVFGVVDSSSGEIVFTGALAASFLNGAITLNGSVSLGTTGAFADGTLALWGASAQFSAAIPSAGEPTTFGTTMNVQVPTEMGDYPLSTASLALTAGGPAPPNLAIAGTLAWANGLSAILSGNIDANGIALSGTFSLGDPAAPVTTAHVVLDSEGATLQSQFELAPLPVVLVQGQIAPGAGALSVTGEVVVGGQPLASSQITVNTHSASFTTDVGFGMVADQPFGSGTIALTLHYATLSLCGSTNVVSPLNANHTCTLGGCMGLSPVLFTVNSLSCTGFCAFGGSCAAGEFCDAIGLCWPQKPLGAGCAFGHECASGFCDFWAGSVCAIPLPDGIGCINNAQCLSGHCGERIGMLQYRCFTPGAANLDDECFDAAHCGQGECWGTPTYPARCLCTTNAQCAASNKYPASYVCKTGSWGVTPNSGFCIPPRAPHEECDQSSECATGLVCGDGRCYAPASKTNGQGCVSTPECIQGECAGGTCRCQTHAHCTNDPFFGSNAYCDQGECKIGKKASNMGEYCADGGWCQSGLCTYSGALLYNTCYTFAGWPKDTPCTVNQQCANGQCVYWFLSGYFCN